MILQLQSVTEELSFAISIFTLIIIGHYGIIFPSYLNDCLVCKHFENSAEGIDDYPESKSINSLTVHILCFGCKNFNPST